MGLFGRRDQIKIHILIRGRIGDGWLDVDTKLAVPPGTTLGKLVEITDREKIPLRQALENSPHLTDTIMLNGERCPIVENGDRVLADGDELYLLAPLAGG
jgi:molybdopterin converting factor small subunit